MDHPTTGSDGTGVNPKGVCINETASPEKTAATWETLTFPGALSVDELQRAESPPSSTASSTDLINSLEQQNQALRDRVEYLESALEQSQVKLRQEVERWQEIALAQTENERIQEQEAIIVEQIQYLTTAQRKISQLFQELERSHQASQRQQIVIETLTHELQVSQERVAQLERECAVTQKRYTEQVQLVHQAEHTCRDLRSRLSRQQRYTLQFKAALEKCLEMPNAASPSSIHATVDPFTPSTGRLGIPKASPVKPWSAPSDDNIDPSYQAWLNSFLSESEDLPVAETFGSESSDIHDLCELSDDESQFTDSEDGSALSVAEDAADPCISSNKQTGEHTRLETWATSQPQEIDSEPGDVAADDDKLTSPFITLNSSRGTDATQSSPSHKRTSLAAVELPTFSSSPGDRSLENAATPELSRPAQPDE
jgi:myosin heavy subunit